MAEMVSASMHGVNAAKRDLARIDAAQDKATRNGLRATGRVVKRAASKAAPRYKGTDKSVVKGRLKKSIRSSSKVKRTGPGSYMISVGARGPTSAYKYAPKIERRDHFMQTGRAAGDAVADGLFSKEYERAIHRK
jgi:hypothetical protein